MIRRFISTLGQSGGSELTKNWKCPVKYDKMKGMNMVDKETPSRKVVTLRKATPKDAVKIFQVLKDMLDSTKLAYPPVDEDAAVLWSVDVLTSPGSLVYVAEVSGRVVGSLGFEAAEFRWAKVGSPERWYLANTWFYIHPKYRKNGTAEALVKKAMVFAKESKIIISFGIFLEQQIELKERFLKMQGLDYVGGTFIYQSHLKE